MPIIIVLLILILLIATFGPIAAGVFAMFVAIAGGVLGAVAVLALAVCFIGTTLLALGWAVWWCFDREGAGKAFAEAEAARDRKAVLRSAARANARR